MDLPESTPHEMPLKDGSVSKSSIILAVVAFGESGFFPPLIFLAVVHLLCSFFAPLTIPLHLSFTSMADLLENPSALTLSVITSHTRLSCLLESVVEIFTLDCFNIFFRLFENRRCKVWFSGALCRGRSNILCHVSPLAHASQKITQRLDYHDGNCLDSELAFG